MISMTRQGTSRQSADDTHRHSPVLVGMGLIGVVLMATAELVLITAGLNAARLDPDPTWRLDCDDTTCTDPWAGARTHYWRVAAGSVVLGLVGWATVGASRPAWRTAPLRRLPRPVPLAGLSASPLLALVTALAADGEHRDEDDPPAATAAAQGAVELGLEVALHRARVRGHPEDHARGERDGDERVGPAQDLLRLERQGLGAPREDDAQQERDRGGDRDAEPHLGEHVAAPALDEVRDEDADDERGLEALAQGDEQIRQEHGRVSGGVADGPRRVDEQKVRRASR